jgi:hypothetical protein
MAAWAMVLLVSSPARPEEVPGVPGAAVAVRRPYPTGPVLLKGRAACRLTCRVAVQKCGLQAMVAGNLASTSCVASGGLRSTCRKARRAARKTWRRRCTAMRGACMGCCRGGLGSCTPSWCGDGEISATAGETCDPPGRTCEVTGRCSGDCRCEGGSPVTATTTTLFTSTTIVGTTTTTLFTSTTIVGTTTTTLPSGPCGNGLLDAGEMCDGTEVPCPSGGQCMGCVCYAVVPSVSDDDFPTAEASLVGAGLQVGRLQFDPRVALRPPLASIWDQDPAPGSLVAFGTAVNLFALVPPDPDEFLTFLFQGVAPSTESESAYYSAVDPDDRRLTLTAWKSMNGFGAPTASAVYLNHNDLGFGRHMVMKRTDGRIAYYVDNHPSVDEVIDGRNLIATVAMEFSPRDDGSGEPFIKFFVFKADGQRTALIDLDGRGDKLQPEVCTPCHGGRTSGDYSQNGGNLGSRFIPFDLDSFRYSTRTGFARADQEAQMQLLNEGVRDADRLLGEPRPAIEELVEGWYGGPSLTRPFDGAFVPPGWQPPQAPADAPQLYLGVVKASCRGCHVQTTLPFDTYTEFASRVDEIQQRVCDEAHMPLALRTFGLFWLGPASHALGDFLPGDVAWQEISTPLPGGLLLDLATGTTRPERMLAVGTGPGGGPLVRSSSDGGITWIDDNLGLPADGRASRVLINPADDTLRYVVVRFGPDPGVYRMTAAGWRRDGVGLPEQADVLDISVHPVNTSILYAVLVPDGEAQAELYRTIDGGSTWQLRSRLVDTVALDPGDPTANRLYGTYQEEPIRSDDGGATWNPVGQHPELRFLRLVVGQSGPTNGSTTSRVLYGEGDEMTPPSREGTWKTLDEGQNWTFIGPLRNISIDPFYPGSSYGQLFLAGNGPNDVRDSRLLRIDAGGRWRVANLTETPDDSGATVRFSTRTRSYLFENAFEGRLFRGDKQACGTQAAPGHPSARASSALSGIVGQRVELDGSGSLLGDGTYTFSWTLLAAIDSTATLLDAQTSHPSFVPDVPGTYALRLEIGRDVGGTFEVADATLVWVHVTEAPGTVHFARDVVPLFGQCQQCHLPPSPPNGFDLTGSTDEVYQQVTARVNLAQPTQSLVLRKPSLQVSHDGGKRMDFGVGESSYQTVLSWITQGAPNN